MPLQKMKFTVQIKADETDETPEGYVEHEVDVIHGDRLRAELEASKLNLPSIDKAPMNFTTLWCWAALTRTKAYTKPAANFLRTDCIGLEGEDEPEDEDPTRLAEPSLSPSN